MNTKKSFRFNQQSTVFKYSLIGFSFGLCFPIGGWIFEYFINDISFTFNGIIVLHKTTPVHFIIDSAPLVLGGTAWFIGRLQQKVERESKRLKKQLKQSNQLAYREAINTKRINEFSLFVSMGNLDFDVDIHDKNDELGKSLHTIQTSLLEASKSDKIEKWKANGYADFLQIMRKYEDNTELLSRTLISSLAKFLHSHYGALYLIDYSKKNPVLLLAASFAGGNYQEQEKEIMKGEGLIGQAWADQKTRNLSVIPENFQKIQSGLGEKLPNALLIIPLVYNDDIAGILEISSFKKYEKHEIEFIEKLSETIAATFISSHSKSQNMELLNRAEKLSIDLRTNEENMRQQIEEMRATQEELDRQNKSTKKKLQAIEEIVGEIKWNNDNIQNPSIFNSKSGKKQ